MTQTDEKYLQEIINQQNKDTYEEQLTTCPSLEAFQRLSVQAEAVLAWYDFDSAWEVLEIGGDYGERTGLLCDRCGHVDSVEEDDDRRKLLKKRHIARTNLDTYASLEELPTGKKYDLIVCVGSFERRAGAKQELTCDQYLNQLTARLKDEGRLLLSIHNRLGLQKFCGEISEEGELPFQRINPDNCEERLFSRKEIEDLLQASAFSNYKCYYPLPDERLTQLVYTDSHLPEWNVNERLIPYHVSNQSLVLEEHKMYKDVIENGLFPAMANCFLFECTKSDSTKLCDVEYAAISADRGPKLSYATTIRAGDKVKKLPLFQEGQTSAQELVQRCDELIARGLPVLPLTWKASGDRKEIEMDFVHGEQLSVYFASIMKESTKQFIAIFDKMYQYILQASDEVSAQKNCFVNLENAHLDWGPILENAYMELIPLNCFWMKKGLLYYDQEFVKANCPAGYVMFRAIHYTYGFSPDTEQYVPMEELKARYHLTDTWEFYLQEENAFLDRVRNHKMYQRFYQWAWVSQQQVNQNICRLMDKEPQGAERKTTKDVPYFISDNLEQQLKDKRIVVFGAGVNLDRFLERFPYYKPEFIIDNNKLKWGTTKAGYPIRRPESLFDIPEDCRCVVVCSKFYDTITAQLHSMGISHPLIFYPDLGRGIS